MKIKVIAFCGSLRQGSYNKKLVNEALLGAKEAGAQVKFIDLNDYSLPMYNFDLEKKKGTPKAAEELKKIIKKSDAFLIASPEYNGALSGVLKNMIDWTSRKEGQEPNHAWKDKVCCIMTASPGRLGGIRGLPIMRHIFSVLGMFVHHDQLALGGAATAFDEKGRIIDTNMRARVKLLGKEAVDLAKKLSEKTSQ